MPDHSQSLVVHVWKGYVRKSCSRQCGYSVSFLGTRSVGISLRQPGALFRGFRCVSHRIIPINAVGIDPVKRGRMSEKLEEQRHETVPKRYLDRIGQDFLPTQAAPVADH